jgi:hypothetical protein
MSSIGPLKLTAFGVAAQDLETWQWWFLSEEEIDALDATEKYQLS